MNSMKFTHTSSLRGELTVPGDKSISHRSVMFGALADGLTEIHGFLQGADCLSTISCFSKMGTSIENQGETVLVHGRGLHGLTAPDSVLDCGNSGTTTRLISGILSAQKFDTTLTGDASIQKRPMKRIIDPLSQMGAKIESVNGNDCAPLHITGSPLHGIHYNSPVASAQVKSSILLAGLYADGETRVTEPYISRDHSERMLSAFGADIHTDGTTAILQPAKQLYGQKILVPGDISSAAFFIAAGLIVPDSEILIKNVGINPTRDGILRVCKAMNADVELLNVNTASGEPTADLLVRSGKLTGTAIEGDHPDSHRRASGDRCDGVLCRGNHRHTRCRGTEGKRVKPHCCHGREFNRYGRGCDRDRGWHDHPRRQAAARCCDRQQEGSPHRHDFRRCRTRRFRRDRNSGCRLREHLLSGILWGSGTVV